MVVGMQRRSGLRTALASVGGQERLDHCGDRGALVGGPGHAGFSAQVGDGERAVGGLRPAVGQPVGGGDEAAVRLGQRPAVGMLLVFGAAVAGSCAGHVDQGRDAPGRLGPPGDRRPTATGAGDWPWPAAGRPELTGHNLWRWMPVQAFGRQRFGSGGCRSRRRWCSWSRRPPACWGGWCSRACWRRGSGPRRGCRATGGGRSRRCWCRTAVSSGRSRTWRSLKSGSERNLGHPA
jgi:hypothetical protein